MGAGQAGLGGKMAKLKIPHGNLRKIHHARLQVPFTNRCEVRGKLAALPGYTRAKGVDGEAMAFVETHIDVGARMQIGHATSAIAKGDIRQMQLALGSLKVRRPQADGYGAVIIEHAAQRHGGLVKPRAHPGQVGLYNGLAMHDAFVQIALHPVARGGKHWRIGAAEPQ